MPLGGASPDLSRLGPRGRFEALSAFLSSPAPTSRTMVVAGIAKDQNKGSRADFGCGPKVLLRIPRAVTSPPGTFEPRHSMPVSREQFVQQLVASRLMTEAEVDVFVRTLADDQAAQVA